MADPRRTALRATGSRDVITFRDYLQKLIVKARYVQLKGHGLAHGWLLPHLLSTVEQAHAPGGK